MKIIVDIRMIGFSGIGTYIRNMLKFLRKSFDLTTLGFEPYEDLPFIKMYSGIYSLREQWELFRKIPPCDIFWSPHYNVPLLPVKARKRAVTIHDVFHLANRQKLSFFQRMYAEYVIRRAVLLSDLIITVSEFSRDEIIKHTGLEKNVRVVYNGLDKEMFFSPKITGLENSNIDLEKLSYILFVGSVKPHKNLKNALGAFNLIRENYPELYFLIVGKKDNLITADNEVLRMAANDSRVVFTGVVKDDELPALYARSRLFLFPSLYEGFGLPPLEAQACGCPVVSSNAASLPEVCGDSVLYCDPYSVQDIARKIVQLLNDESLQKKLQNKGLENIKRFSWKNTSDAISQEFYRLLNN